MRVQMTDQQVTVLLVDDDPQILKLGQELLEHLGYQVLVAADGDQAVNLYESKNPVVDLVILDYLLPRRDGGQILRQIRGLDPQAKVILASGFFEQRDIDQLEAAGASGLINKPYRVKELDAQIKKALGQG
ncbi:MAG: response regulator [Deltaproteobacteria bacterium]|nr:response regulator [Deltaproteobacteria bacterium]MBW1952900.1 response regulator [Deltaproteobacteria bacterium]MBW1987134.1 response regulator [Deltaproteobacteria bacterium]MBW2135346.1 response regulator [Deltaproteobacteria bacterium]